MNFCGCVFTLIGEMGGCVSSKVDNEEIVSRCRERRRLMKQAVISRHNFAAAHSAYLRALRNTGIALVQFAEGESMPMSGNVIEEEATSIPATPTTTSRHHTMKFHPPPPPPPPLDPSSPSASPSVESFRMSSKHNPHIRSTSDNSYAGSPPPPPPPPPPFANPIQPKDQTPDDQWASSQYSGTPSYYYQGSGWNGWEPFYPSSSPGIHGHERKKIKQEEFYQREDPMDDNSTDFEDEQEESSFRHEVEGSNRAAGGKSPGREYTDDVSSVTSWCTKDTIEMQMTVARRQLEEIVKNLDGYFVKASAAGKDVSDILETNRAQNEFETRKNLYHSSNVFNALSWTWSSKPPLAIRYSLEPSKISSSSKHGSHCSTLERLLAWEKKLYEEVKNGEARKIEQEKKLALLQNQKVKGENAIKMDRTQASIKRLQSLITVARQAVATTSSAIIKLRDNELCSQLQELSEGLMHMWRSMNECHQFQNSIVQQVKNLGTLAGREFTSDNHRDATLQLEAEVTAWHNSFCSLIKSQRDYIHALYGWARLSLFQLGNEAEWEQGHRPPIYTLCEEWQQAIDRLPDKVASESIKSFISVVHAIVMQQNDEQKRKKKAENLSRELQKKIIALRNIEKKYYSSYALPARTDLTSESQFELDPTDPLAEKRAEIDAYKRRLEDEKANYSKSARGTRAMTLNNIQTGLPGLFQAMSSFSNVCVRSFEHIYNQTKSLNDHSSVRC